MIETIDAGLYRIKVPLPGSPLKYLNAYVIRGAGRHLLIDSGFNLPECREALLESLRRLNVRTADLDYFITHRHADHCGLIPDLAGLTAGSRPPKVMTSAEEGQGMIKTVDWQPYRRALFETMARHGIPPDVLDGLFLAHNDWRFVPGRDFTFTEVKDGDKIEYGDYALTVIGTPGHTPGLVTLYDPARKYYFSADHILGTITPNITSWHDGMDSLGRYLDNLDKVGRLDIALTLTGHRELVEQTEARIRELKKHHQERLVEVLDLLDSGPATAYSTASRLKWNLRADTWDQFPSPQKWFATGEALSHLEHLSQQGLVERSQEQGLYRFFRKT